MINKQSEIIAWINALEQETSLTMTNGLFSPAALSD